MSNNICFYNKVCYSLIMDGLKEPIYCCICGKKITHIMDSHNPEPLAEEGRCCNVCNEEVVWERLKRIREEGL